MNVAVLLWEDAELLDFAGPAQVLAVAGGGDLFHVYTVARDPRPVTSLGILNITPEYTFQDAPKPDIVVVPGGGTAGVCHHAPTLAWLRKAAAEAAIVLSVCTGALVLAAAGLLDGLVATTWHDAIDELRRAAPKSRVIAGPRFVDNGRIITAAGVSAGIDAALHVVGRVVGDRYARFAAEYMEYSVREGM